MAAADDVHEDHQGIPLGLSVLQVPTGEDAVESAAPELFDLTTNTIYKLPPLPGARVGARVVGSSFDWLVTMDYSSTGNRQIQLLNLITRAHIPLPPATLFDNFDQLEFKGGSFPVKYFIQKAILFSDPKPGCMVMAIHGHQRHLGFCRIGDERWTSFGDTQSFYQYQDVTHHKGRFYAVTQKGIVVTCEPDPTRKVVEVVRLPDRRTHMKYLVESSDKLLIVTRFRGHQDHDYWKTVKFTVDKLDVATNECEEVTCLDDQVIFVGNSVSISVSANKVHRCKPNCIYFLNDSEDEYFKDGCFDMGVYDLKNNEVSAFYSPPAHFSRWPMFWITKAC